MRFFRLRSTVSGAVKIQDTESLPNARIIQHLGAPRVTLHVLLNQRWRRSAKRRSELGDQPSSSVHVQRIRQSQRRLESPNGLSGIRQEGQMNRYGFDELPTLKPLGLRLHQAYQSLMQCRGLPVVAGVQMREGHTCERAGLDLGLTDPLRELGRQLVNLARLLKLSKLSGEMCQIVRGDELKLGVLRLRAQAKRLTQRSRRFLVVADPNRENAKIQRGPRPQLHQTGCSSELGRLLQASPRFVPAVRDDLEQADVVKDPNAAEHIAQWNDEFQRPGKQTASSRTVRKQQAESEA